MKFLVLSALIAAASALTYTNIYPGNFYNNRLQANGVPFKLVRHPNGAVVPVDSSHDVHYINNAVRTTVDTIANQAATNIRSIVDTVANQAARAALSGGAVDSAQIANYINNAVRDSVDTFADQAATNIHAIVDTVANQAARSAYSNTGGALASMDSAQVANYINDAVRASVDTFANQDATNIRAIVDSVTNQAARSAYSNTGGALAPTQVVDYINDAVRTSVDTFANQDATNLRAIVDKVANQAARTANSNTGGAPVDSAQVANYINDAVRASVDTIANQAATNVCAIVDNAANQAARNAYSNPGGALAPVDSVQLVNYINNAVRNTVDNVANQAATNIRAILDTVTNQVARTAHLNARGANVPKDSAQVKNVINDAVQAAVSNSGDIWGTSDINIHPVNVFNAGLQAFGLPQGFVSHANGAVVPAEPTAVVEARAAHAAAYAAALRTK